LSIRVSAGYRDGQRNIHIVSSALHETPPPQSGKVRRTVSGEIDEIIGVYSAGEVSLELTSSRCVTNMVKTHL
jgi:hypothetical protein